MAWSAMKLVVAALAVTAATSAPSAQERQLETAVLAGGCFWSVEAAFEHVKGVHGAVSGFAGGTNRAEAVQITFDPRQVSYDQLLRIFFTVVHDPTQVNRQGPDVGPIYRSAVFPRTEAQRRSAERMIVELETSGRFARPIATRIEGGPFSPVGAGHQDFVRKNPRHPYVIAYSVPKLARLKEAYPRLWRV